MRKVLALLVAAILLNSCASDVKRPSPAVTKAPAASQASGGKALPGRTDTGEAAASVDKKPKLDPSVFKGLSSELLLQKFKQNGESYLCAQENYYSCFKASSARCVRDQSIFKTRCYNQALEKVGKIVMGGNDREFVQYFGKCMELSHLVIYQEKIPDISTCIKSKVLDEDFGIYQVIQ